MRTVLNRGGRAMPDITLHDLDEKTYAAVRRAAEDEDLSLNQVIKRALRNAAREGCLGAVSARSPAAAYNAFAGEVPNLSLVVEADVLDGARAVARARGTSVVALVRAFLAGLSAEGAKPAPRRLGDWKGLVRIAPDFDEWPEDLAAAFGMRGGADT